MEIHYFGHSSFLLNSKGKNVLLDPFITSSADSPKRLVKAPLKKEDLPKIDLILVSNEQPDHFDKKTIEFVQKRDSSVVVGHTSMLNRLDISDAFKSPFEAHQKRMLRKVLVEAKPAHRPPLFYPLSYLLDIDGTTVFHAGDTKLLDSFSEIKPHVALLPIGGESSMDIIDAVKATKTMKPKIVIPMKYNTFENIKADPQEFKQRIEKSILNTEAIILAPGEKYKF